MPPAARRRASRPAAVLLAGLVPVFASAVLAIYRPPAFARVDDSVYDALLRGTPTRPPSDRIAIVDVDEASLASVGQWPWPRPVMARLIARLREMGASVVALDIIFAESDRFAVVESAGGGRGTQRLPDEILADTLSKGGVVLGYGLTFDPPGRVRTPCVLHPVSLAMLHRGEEADSPPFFRASGAICSLPLLARAARASGFLNAAPDADGILRRVPLVAQLDGRVYPSLAIAAVSAATGVSDLALHVSTVNAARLTLDDRAVPVDGRSNLLLRYRGEKRTFPYLSAGEVLEELVSADRVRGKIVLVGTTALGTREVVATPLDTLFAGVEVQATVADNLLQGDFISRSPAGNVFEALAVLGLGTALSVLVAVGGIVAGALAAGILVLATWWAAGALLAAGVFVSPLAPSLGLVSALASMTFVRARIERGRAESAGRQRTDAQRLMVQTLLSLTETRDAETGRHSRRTQQYARLLAEQLARHPDFRAYLTPERIDLLSSLAPLHDIGKVGIPDHILNKPGPLTPEELIEMRRHPVLGRDVILRAEQQVGIRDDATLALAKDIVYTHHERWDGAGYPQGLRDTQIPIAGRLMAIVDVYDAVVTRTLYQASMSHEDAVKFIVGRRGTHFDPAVVEAFERVAPEFAALAHDAAAPDVPAPVGS